MSRFIDLTGKKFSKLTVIKEQGRDTQGHVKWLCKCDCGNEILVSSSNLRRGNTRSCGCLRKRMKDLTGKRFGKLTVIKKYGKDIHGHVKWLCKCDCGNESIVISNNLSNDKTRSCGCLRNKINKGDIILHG